MSLLRGELLHGWEGGACLEAGLLHLLGEQFRVLAPLLATSHPFYYKVRQSKQSVPPTSLKGSPLLLQAVRSPVILVVSAPSYLC